MGRGIVRKLGSRGLLKFLPDKLYLKLAYRSELKSKLHLKTPKKYTEKLQWIKLYDRKEEYHSYVDKWLARNVVSERIPDDILIPIIGVFDSVESIPWDSLPDRFVIKCTHGSGSNIICRDKSSFDVASAKKQLKTWMKKEWFWLGREWPYVGLTPRIICEEYISEFDKSPDDYKIWCFNGKPLIINIHRDRFGDHRQDFYSLQGKQFAFNNIGYVNSDVKQIAITPSIQKCLEYARILSKNTFFSRIDFYIAQNRVYFGEITFFDGAGFCDFVPDEVNYLLGNCLHLPIDKETIDSMPEIEEKYIKD